ncbi:IclR family transcriptional regulator C-terminal domain-containing protein [Halomicroarcula sp. GCM10025709]|uniref:IclR family transcriptional regulator domain-containing protein n=1 Tax=Haloarcula TaxID=2237 RepID=UPI0024C23275|nr:IclR family transcriptional regulator C-terminal domain-containing protein [Halomicroarcula sp. YJ-61-S]
MSDSRSGPDGDTVQTVQTSFRVLEALEAKQPAGVTEVAESLDLSKSAAHRHLSTLRAEGKVEQVDGDYRRTLGDQTASLDVAFGIIEVLKERGQAPVEAVAEELDVLPSTVEHYLSWLESEDYVVQRGNQYENGLRFLDLGERVKHSTGVFDIAADEVDRLADESGELALFSLEEHGENVLMYKSNGDDAIQTSHEIGLREPLHCSGLGKAILSELPRKRVEAIVDERGLPQFTEHTITSRDRLFDELERTRERGYAIDDEEAKPGIRCVAAPVVLGDGDLYGAVSVTAPRSRMEGERLEEELPEIVTGVANVIEVNAIYA